MRDNRVDIFSVPIWGFILNDQKYQSKDYIDTILSLEKTEPSVKKSNSGGYQTHDNLHDIPVFKEFVSALERISASCCEEYLSKQCKTIVTEMWGNINYKYCYNAAHIHGGALSGVFYLKAPKNCGKLILRNPAVRSDGQLINTPNYSIVPENLALILFPSWLEHYVEPNLSEEVRMSISFNFKVSR